MAVAWEDTHYPAGRYVVLLGRRRPIGFPMSKVTVARRRQPHRDRCHATRRVRSGSRSTAPARPIRSATCASSGPAPKRPTRSQPFNPEFLKKTKPFSVLRFMDWGMTNGSPVARVGRPLARRRRHLRERERRADRGDDQAREHAACRPVVLHPAPRHRRLRAPVRDLAARHARPDPRPHIEYSNEVWNTSFAQAH